MTSTPASPLSERSGLNVRVVLQRISSGQVRVDDLVVGRAGARALLLVGFTEGDTTEAVDWMADKVVGLRVFADGEGKMNRSLEDIEGDLLVVSQFTLYGDTSKGRRPSFVHAAPPDVAVPL